MADSVAAEMTRSTIQMTGFPYFPGVASAPLQIGRKDNIAEHILLITHDELGSFSDLPAGFIVVEALPFSHSMIGLLGLGVPTVLISHEQLAMLEQGMPLVIDGSRGLISNDVAAALAAEDSSHITQVTRPFVMADGEPVNLLASVRQSSAAKQARELGAEAIGLVRSEFLLPENGQAPDEAFYLQAFRQICEAAAPLTVTFRLLDVAADKIPSWLSALDSHDQVLSVQGVRLYNDASVKRVIEAQLSALAQLTNDYSLRVLLPFLVRLEEYDYWLKQIRYSLPQHVPVGAMAETPAMLLDMQHLLDHAEFVAVGCNDLMQSVFAADRDQSELRHYLDPYAPLLYRLFKQVADQTGANLNRVQLCGVLSQIQGVLPVLLGLGYRNFSVDAPFIPYLAHSVSQLTKAECETLAGQVCAATTTQDVLQILRLPVDRHVPYSF